MAFFKPRPVGDFLQRRKLLLLRREAEAQRALVEKVRALLPEPLAAHCTAARLEERTLTLFVDSPAWASRLRFIGTETMDRLGQSGLYATT